MTALGIASYLSLQSVPMKPTVFPKTFTMPFILSSRGFSVESPSAYFHWATLSVFLLLSGLTAVDKGDLLLLLLLFGNPLNGNVPSGV